MIKFWIQLRNYQDLRYQAGIAREKMKFKVTKTSIKTYVGRKHSNTRFKHFSRGLRTFARKFSNIDFFLRILPLKVDELVMSEM